MPRPLKPIISRENATAAALEVIEEVGLKDFQLAQVAQKLGVRAPSLYHHFEGREELLSEVARLLLLEGTLPPISTDTDWREEILQISVASWRSVLRHPNAAPLLLQFFPRRLLIGAYEYWFHLLDAHHVPVEWHMTILEGTDKMTWGSALFLAASRVEKVDPYGPPNPAKHPYLAAAVAAHPYDDEQTFVETIRCFLRGVPDAR